MKFVANRPFFNTSTLNLTIDKKSPGFQHEAHVHKGYRFEIASGTQSIEAVKSATDKQNIAALVLYEFAIVDDGSPASKDGIKRIDFEVAAETAAAAAAEKNRPLSIADQIATGVAAALAKLGVKVPA